MLKVETFEVVVADDPTSEIDDADAFAELATSLGLTGQERFVRGQDDGSVKTMPYRQLTREEDFVYREVCPAKARIENYASGPIPVRVLQVYEHARSLDFFERFEVWSAESADIPDPVLIGVCKPDPSKTYHEEFYILARWGAELLALADLVKIAAKKWRARFKAKALECQAKVEADLSRLENADPLAFRYRDAPFYNGMSTHR